MKSLLLPIMFYLGIGCAGVQAPIQPQCNDKIPDRASSSASLLDTLYQQTMENPSFMNVKCSSEMIKIEAVRRFADVGDVSCGSIEAHEVYKGNGDFNVASIVVETCDNNGRGQFTWNLSGHYRGELFPGKPYKNIQNSCSCDKGIPHIKNIDSIVNKDYGRQFDVKADETAWRVLLR